MKSSNPRVTIIGGQWRGRKLAVADQPGLRPTGSRIRETLFNWLQPVISESHCLDLFSGTGALGFEALSRGAASATMLEQSAVALKQLLTNQQVLGAQAKIVAGSCVEWLKQPPAKAADIVFIDPPFKHNLWGEVIAGLQRPGHLAQEAWVYIESPENHLLSLPANWHTHRHKSAGNVDFRLLKVCGSPPL